VISSDSVNIRRAPKKGADKITSVDEGTRVVILAKRNSWYKLRFPKGTEGWVRGDMLRPSHEEVVAMHSHKRGHRSTETVALNSHRKHETGLPESSLPVGSTALLISRAESYRGVPYSWGGTSRSGVDCSGFTTSVFRSQGISLPRTAAEQSSRGHAVSRGDLTAGDLVFFHTGRSRRINHVGIYIGSGNFIHASSGGGQVQINSLNEGYYNERFSTARRVLKHGQRVKLPKVDEAEATTTEAPQGTATGTTTDGIDDSGN
jgi:hypothetical protein